MRMHTASICKLAIRLLGLWACFVLAAVPGQAATFTVANLNDSGAGSLRQAIADANANPGTDDVIFDVNGTILLSSQLPSVTDNGTRILGETAPHLGPGPDIEIRPAGAVFDGLVFDGVQDCIVRGMEFTGFGRAIVVLGWGATYTGHELGGTDPDYRNLIHLCGFGMVLTGVGCETNKIYNNHIVSNYETGIMLQEGPGNNQIGGDDPWMANLISGCSGWGIYLGGSLEAVKDNVIRGNLIGTDSTGTVAVGNGHDGIHLSGALCEQNAITANVIAANDEEGIELNGCHDNTIDRNHIGTDVTGTVDLGNQRNGVLMTESAHQNTVGPGNVISGNGANGVHIRDSGADGNHVIQNRIGLDAGGVTALPNAVDGVMISAGPVGCEITGNTIGGNGAHGVEISDSGTSGHWIENNRIGTDAAGGIPLANGQHGIYFWSQTTGNEVHNNLVSGNGGDGIRISDFGTDSHVLAGNLVGTDISGKVGLPNGGPAEGGIHLTNTCKYCTIGPDNLVSGHDDAGQFGICLEHDNTSNHVIKENIVGLDIDQAYALPNETGIVVSDGASYNDVGPQNVIAGNLRCGVLIERTESVNVFANRIGTDLAGTTALGNRNGICLSGPYNQIGGHQSAGEGNLISGNAEWGIFARSDELGPLNENLIYGNTIGLDADGNPMGNGAGGIFLGCTMCLQRIGDRPASADYANTIAHNGGPGIRIGETCPAGVPLPTGNTVAVNEIYQNAGDGVVVRDSSFYNPILTNAISENGGAGILLQNGGNHEIVAPTITSASTTLIEGTTNLAAGDDTVQVFYGDDDEGRTYVGEVYVPSGTPAWSLALASPIPGGVYVTATNTGCPVGWWETSAFSNAVWVAGGSGVDAAEEPGAGRPQRLALSRVTPNPTRAGGQMMLTTPRPVDLSLRVFDAMGRCIRTLRLPGLDPGEHLVAWDGRDNRGRRAPGGVYLLEARFGGRTAQRRVTLLK